MKIFAATLFTETNTFSAVPTGAINFEAGGFFRRQASHDDPNGVGVFHAELRRLAERDGHHVIESIATKAEPAGLTVRTVYEGFRESIIQDLREALPVQAVVLFLHGAMVADGYEDCEGDLLHHVRSLVGPGVPIGIELDLHCHFSEEMRLNADIAICFKEYPHTDGLDRLREVYHLVVKQALGSIRPRTAVYECRMVGVWPTTQEPMASFVRKLRSHEETEGILSVSLGHGFPWGDVPGAGAGAKIWVISDGDDSKAQALANQLGQEFWELRTQISLAPATLTEAVLALRNATEWPMVWADVADNAGGGAMSDSTFILQALLEQGIYDAVIGSYWDLGAIAICTAAGVGGHLNLRLGGKCGPASGTPIDLPVTVKAIVPDHYQFGLSMRRSLGAAVWVQTDNGIDIAINSIRSQVMSPEAFTGLGIPLDGRRLVVVKSTQHFHSGFSPLTRNILYVGTGGALRQDFSNMMYARRSNHFWPRISDPHGSYP